MSIQSQFVELNRLLHDREHFDCGEAELNLFLQTQAAKHMSIGISKTMVLAENNLLNNGKQSIYAFYTIAPATIHRQNIPTKLSKKLPQYPIPVFLIGQLAVDSSHKGQGLGKVTLLHALKYLWQVKSYLPAYAVIVDCLHEQAKGFYLQYDFQELYEHAGKSRLYLPMATLDQLFT